LLLAQLATAWAIPTPISRNGKASSSLSLQPLAKPVRLALWLPAG